MQSTLVGTSTKKSRSSTGITPVVGPSRYGRPYARQPRLTAIVSHTKPIRRNSGASIRSGLMRCLRQYKTAIDGMNEITIRDSTYSIRIFHVQEIKITSSVG